MFGIIIDNNGRHIKQMAIIKKRNMKLFYGKSFTDYERESYKSISEDIRNLTDDYLLSFKDNLDALAKTICNKHYMNCNIEMNFNVKKVDVIKHPVKPGIDKRLVQYSIPFKGNSEYFSVFPYNDNHSHILEIGYKIEHSNLVYLIDINYYGDIGEQQVQLARATNLKVEDYITQSLLSLKAKCESFNAKIDKEVLDNLKSLTPAAEKRQIANKLLNL